MWIAMLIALILVVVILWAGVCTKRKATQSAYMSAEEKLKSLEQRDAELFAQGKSFDEVMSHYKKTEN